MHVGFKYISSSFQKFTERNVRSFLIILKLLTEFNQKGKGNNLGTKPINIWNVSTKKQWYFWEMMAKPNFATMKYKANFLG